MSELSSTRVQRGTPDQCPHCKQKIETDSACCPYCGADLKIGLPETLITGSRKKDIALGYGAWLMSVVITIGITAIFRIKADGAAMVSLFGALASIFLTPIFYLLPSGKSRAFRSGLQYGLWTYFILLLGACCVCTTYALRHWGQ